MSNPSKGPRLYLRRAGSGRAAVWLIRDGERIISTGCAAQAIGEAEKRLAEYINEKHQPSRADGRHPSQVKIADVLSIYADDRASKIARPIELAQRLAALDRYFGGWTLDKVNGKSCRAYVKHRGSQAAARRELEDLRAAINHHRREGLCSEIVEVALPERLVPRERWLTRSEAARLLWAAWRGGQGKRKHIARFILVGLYTGTRAGAICKAAIQPTVGRGFVDLERGVFYRRAAGERETKKRQPPTRIHPRLLAHLARWKRLGLVHDSVVEWQGEPVGRIAKSFRRAAVEAGLPDVTPHVLRHTAITWAMQNGADRWETAGMFGITLEMIERVYGHHRPDHGASVHRALSAKRV